MFRSQHSSRHADMPIVSMTWLSSIENVFPCHHKEPLHVMARTVTLVGTFSADDTPHPFYRYALFLARSEYPVVLKYAC